MQYVIEEKERQKEKTLNKKWDRYSPILIGGDAFSMGYLIFQGILSIKPALAAISAISMSTLILGEIAGVINVGVAIISLKEAIQAFANGDKKLGWRLVFDAVLFAAIGVVMILVSTSLKVGAFGAIGAFFSANPWVLPLLFLLASLPVIIEVSRNTYHIWRKNDLGSQMQLGKLEKLLNEDWTNWKEIYKIYRSLPVDFETLHQNIPEKEIIKKVSEKMEFFQAGMGTPAAIEMMKLLQQLVQGDRDRAIAQLEITKKRIAEWKRAQHVRLLQQILYILSFAVSMIGLSPAGGRILSSAQNFSMAAANAIPLYMDIFWPFKRNTPQVVPKVEVPAKLALIKA